MKPIFSKGRKTMKNLQTKTVLTICAVVLMTGTLAMATPVGPTVQVRQKDGIYQVEMISGSIGDYTQGDKFMTFCIETNERRNPKVALAEISTIAKLNSKDPNKGYDPILGGDPLGAEAAWIYTEFMAGTFSGYKNKDVQKAARFAEEEYRSISGKAKEIYKLAVAASPTGLGDVRVINILHTYDHPHGKWQAGDPAQSFLVTVPEPATMTLLGLGGVMTLIHRKRRAC